MVRELWVFATKEKLEKFQAVIAERGIEFETEARAGGKYAISVEESDYSKAKRILLKHRERRTSGDLA